MKSCEFCNSRKERGLVVIKKLTSLKGEDTGWAYDMVLCDDCLEELINFIKTKKIKDGKVKKTLKKRKAVFTDTCYICKKRIIGFESNYGKSWISNFKGLSAHINCLKKGGDLNEQKR